MTRWQEPSSGWRPDRAGPAWREERGQSLIILAFAMVALLALMGLALDLGIVYGRRVQLARATDAAAMAAVVEPYTTTTAILATRAGEFMAANSLPEAVVTATRVVSPDLGTARLVDGNQRAVRLRGHELACRRDDLRAIRRRLAFVLRDHERELKQYEQGADEREVSLHS